MDPRATQKFTLQIRVIPGKGLLLLLHRQLFRQTFKIYAFPGLVIGRLLRDSGFRRFYVLVVFSEWSYYT